MQSLYKKACVLFFAACLFSFSSLAEDTSGLEAKPDDAAEPPKSVAEPEQATKEYQEPANPESAPPALDQPAAKTPPTEDKPGETAPAKEAIQPETPPATTVTETVDESQSPDAKPVEKLPYAKGDMEADLSVALAGTGDDFYFGVAASYGYYVADRFSLGLYLQYTHIFSDAVYDYKPPESIMFLPYLKFAITRTKSVSPYLFVTGGYEAKWTAGAKDGYSSSPNGWLLGGGGGVHVGITKQVVINIRLMGAYKWYTDTQIYRYKDSDLYRNRDDVEGGTYKCDINDDCNVDEQDGRDLQKHLYRKEDSVEVDYYCYDSESCKQVYDKKDKKSEGLFPLITIGVTVLF